MHSAHCKHTQQIVCMNLFISTYVAIIIKGKDDISFRGNSGIMGCVGREDMGGVGGRKKRREEK